MCAKFKSRKNTDTRAKKIDSHNMRAHIYEKGVFGDESIA